MKKKLKRVIMLILFTVCVWILSNGVNAAYISVSPSKSSAGAGEKVSVTVSSDCVGRVNLSASNGTLSDSKVWIEGSSQTVTLTVGSSGTASVTATAQNGKMSSGGTDIAVSGGSCSVAIASSSASAGTSSSTSSSSTSSQTSQEKGSTPETTSSTSSNANLSTLGITPNDFSGFKAGTTTYNVTVPQNVEKVNVYAKAQDSKAKVSGTGDKTLKEGANAVSVVVTAQDGTTKTYTINVTRQGEGETEENTTEEETETTTEENKTEEVQGNGLSKLQFENLELSPQFSTNIYEYTARYIGEATSLNITTEATDSTYKIDVLGNEDLKEGENYITVMVGDSTGVNVATYQVKLSKSLIDEEAVAREKAEKEQQKKIIAAVVVGVVIFIAIIAIIVKHVKNKKSDKYDDDDEDEYNTYLNEQKATSQQKELEDEDKIVENDDKEKKKKAKGKRYK